MEFAAPALLIAVFVGVTELITRARARDWWVVLTILTCAAVGAFFGLIHYFPGVDWVEGLVYGFAGSGVLKTVSVFGNKTSAAPSKAVRK